MTPSPFYRLPDVQTPGLTSRMSLRIALLGLIALTLFAIVFFRLWFLQVLSGEKFLAEANDNRIREIKIEAPRGEILDRNGDRLVSNRGSWQVQIDQRRWGIHLGKRGNLVADPGFAPVLNRVARVLGESSNRVKQRMRHSLEQLPFANVTAATDVSLEDVVQISERQERYPGVEVTQTFERSYPRDVLAAHLFGYVREVDATQLESGKYEGARQGDRVGQEGLEREYDRYLRGRNGTQRIQVDVADRARGFLPGVSPRTGQSLRLTLDLGVQKTGEEALRLASSGNRTHGSAFVAMDIKSGEVLGLGSYPTFDPAVYTGVLKPAEYKRLTAKNTGTPLTNRAIASVYPAASTFKPVTAIAGLEAGIISPGTVVNDGGKIKVGEAYRQNAGGFAYGPVDLRRALQVSSDVYFYQLGMQANAHGGALIQRWAGRLGLGRAPGIDLPGASQGLVPTPAWRNRLFKKYKGTRYATDPWSIGHTVNLAIGQGDLQVSPLQMAIVYAAIGNGGYIVKPHLGLRIDNARGQVVQDIDQPARRQVKMNGGYRQVILEGLYRAANAPGGTSTDVFAGFPVKIAGKTGTAQTPKGDQSWYVALAPYPNPRYVVVTTVEQGGFGAETAAPAARLILARLFKKKLKDKFVRGKSRTQ